MMCHRQRRLGFLVLGGALLLLSVATQPASACRCAQRSLGEYFQTADEVLVARLSSTTVEGERRTFHFEAPQMVMKSAATSLPYVSSTSSASCAVSAEPGATYVVFAEHDANTGVAWLSTCNGTRIHLPTEGEARGFDDVPTRFVVSQLNALAGLDLLQRIAAHEPRPDDPDSRGLVGLLDIAPFAHGGSVPLYGGPDAASPVLATVSAMAELDSHESSYEIPSACVFAVVDGWYKLRRRGGDWGWLAAASAGTYWPMDELPVQRLSYLNEHWDGFVWPEVGAGLPLRSPRHGESVGGRVAVPINVLESLRLGGSLWFRIEIYDKSICEGGDAPRIQMTGWIPAYGADGEPATWFFSRGC